MPNPTIANPQIGIAGNARSYGIIALAVQWLGPSGNIRTLSVLSSYDKDGDATVQTGTDNNNEVVNLNRSQRKFAVKLTAIASSDTQADAAAIATDLPIKMDLLNVGHMTAGAFVSGSTTGAESGTAVPQIETTSAICDAASAKRSPEGALMIEISATIHLNPDGSFKVFAVLT